MPAITSVRMLRSGVVGGRNNFFVLNTDFDINTRDASNVTVTGDASLFGITSGGARLSYLLLNIASGDVSSGSCTITIATDAITPNLDRAYTYTLAWTGGNFGTPMEAGGTPLPTPTITPVSTSLINGGTTTVNVTFPEAVTGFTANSVTVSAGTISGFTGSGTSYSFTLTAPSSGTGTINIDITATSDWQAATRATVNYAPTPPPALPKPTISPVATSLTNGGTTTVNITFPSSVTGFTANSVTLSAGSISGFTGSGRNYSFTLTAPNSGTGTINIDIAGTSSWEAATRATVSYAPATPARTVTIAPTSTSIQRGQSTTVRITFSGTGAVQGFTNSDIQVSTGTKSGFNPQGNTGRVIVFTLTAPSTGTGTITIRVPANAISNAEGNTAASATVAYTAPPRPGPGAGDLNMEAIDEQFIVIGTENYELEIDLMGGPTKAEVGGLPEGFYYDWDRSAQKMYIKSDLVETLSTGFAWQVELSKGNNEFIGQIAYHVIPPGAIFYALGLLHLYRDVPINFDIIIDNLPPVLIPFLELIGIKQESREYGINFSGEIPSSARFAENTGNLVFAVLDAEGAVIDSHDYPYQIESGAPPQIQTPVFSPKGGYGTLEFPDVRHAIAYDWQLEGVDTTWNTFDGTREIIDPGSVEVTTGQLSATVRFRHVQGASRYQYSLESESHIVEWTYFDGTLQNGFITTIIPNLQDGVRYTLRLRVGAPWIGTPIEVTVYGGRLCYALHEGIGAVATRQHVLYIFNTATPDGGTSPVIKRIKIPVGQMRSISDLAIDFKRNEFYLIVGTTQGTGIHVYSLDTADNAVASRLRFFTAPTGLSSGAYNGGFFDDTLYCGNFNLTDFESFSALTANNQSASTINVYNAVIPNENILRCYATDVSDEIIYMYSNYGRIIQMPRIPVTFSNVLVSHFSIQPVGRDVIGLSVVADRAYLSRDVSSSLTPAEIRVLDINKPVSEQIIKTFRPPVGCNRIVGLKVDPA